MSDTSSHQLFSFSQETDEAANLPVPSPHHAVEKLSEVVAHRELEEIGRAVISAGEAAYHWIIETDSHFVECQFRRCAGLRTRRARQRALLLANARCR